MKFHLLALYRNLVAGARLALFLPVRAFDYRVSPLDYSWLLIFNFAVWVAAAAIRTGLAGEFDSSAVPIYLASVPLVLVTAMVVAFVYGERERLLLIATALTASDSTFELVALALPPLVGFAPDASQDVFVKEMRFVRRLFDERFGTAGRSIALASSQDALEEFPIASVTNLSRALTRVGERMNADEDTLFLFLTAHGYRDHRLSAVQPPLDLAPLTPTALSRLLQDAGIKWRVIVVSACYSGGFIEPLRDDNSVVITASSPDRSSFGCEPGRDFTYFGEAYFRDALARTRSFVQAFELAKAAVGRQETAEKLTPSLPQMWVGPAIAERLKQAADSPDKE